MKSLPEREPAPTLEDDIEPDGQPWWSGVKPEFMLSVRFKSGDQVVYSYQDFRGAKLSGENLALYFDTAIVRITGKGLGTLLGKLRRHCVRYIQERHADPQFGQVAGDFIQSIAIEKPDLEELGKRER